VPGAYFPYLGMAIAFILPVAGAYAGSQWSLYYIKMGWNAFTLDYRNNLMSTTKTNFIMNSFVILLNNMQAAFGLAVFTQLVSLVGYATYSLGYLVELNSKQMADYDNDVNKYPGEAAIKILFYGVLLGVAGYAAGVAMANKIETIYQMLGLNGSTTKNYD